MVRCRSLIVAVAAVAMVVVTGPVAQAETIELIVSPDDLVGWQIGGFPDGSVDFEFSEATATRGDGSLQFGPLVNGADGAKFIAGRTFTLPLFIFESYTYDFYIDPAASNTDPAHYYLNVYVNGIDAQDDDFYDCRYDFVPTAGATGWNTLGIGPATVATNVAVVGPTAAQCGATIGDAVDEENAVITLTTLNGGDTSTNDEGLEGGFDNVRISAGGDTVIFDFEAAANVPTSKRDCKKGGWRDLERADRTPFKNQGDCIQYVNTGK